MRAVTKSATAVAISAYTSKQNAGNAASAEVKIAFWRLLVLLHLEASHTLCFASVASHRPARRLPTDSN